MKEEFHRFACPADVPEWVWSHHRHERRDAAEHRQRILDVARHLFAEHGVDAVSMHQIALAAGIGQGTLYRRYRHKGELCVDLMREHHERIGQEIAALLAEKETASVLERLDAVLNKMVILLEEQVTFLGPIGGITPHDAHCNESDSAHYSYRQSPLYLWFHTLLSGLLAQAVEHGELVSLDIPFTVDAMLAVLNPLFYRFQRLERGFSQERILQGVHRIYIEGFRNL